MKKTKWVILFLALVICVAVFANWELLRGKFSGQQSTGGGVLVSDQGQTGSYFENARYTRQKTRDEAISVLNSVIGNAEADEDAKKAAAENINGYAVAAERENKIENLIASKGFSDCVAFVGNDNVSVVVKVSSGGLSAAEASQITDIVVSETGFRTDVIKIIEMNES